MIKLSTLLVLLLVIAQPSTAGPKEWVKHHKRFLLAAGTITAASIIQYKGTSYCQRGDVERCNEGYGSRRTFDWISVGTSAAMLGAAEGCWKDQPSWKFCYGLAYGMPTYQTYAGLHDFASYRPETDHVHQAIHLLSR
jgi:hypothetical protein